MAEPHGNSHHRCAPLVSLGQHPTPVFCQACGSPHAHHSARDQSRGSDGWYCSEQTRRAWSEPGVCFPEAALGPLRNDSEAYAFNVYSKKLIGGEEYMPRRRDSTLRLSWDGYYDFLIQASQGVARKGQLALTNLSTGPARRDHNQAWADRIFLDSDSAGNWHQLASFFAYYGIRAIFHESSGSVRRREAAGDFNSQLQADSWHVEIPLARRVVNHWSTGDRDAPQDRNWGHWKGEWKRAYRHCVALFSAFAHFKGVGGKCGFDLATSALCQMRFLGARQGPEGILPYVYMVPGDNALDLERLLQLTGYQPAPIPQDPLPKVKTVQYTAASGEVRERRIITHSAQLYVDVKAKISVHEYMQSQLGRMPTRQAGSNSAFYFCPIHHEETNPSGLESGPNREGFNVFVGSTGEERWKCLGDCRSSLGEKGSGGDVISLHSAVTGVSPGKAAWGLARIVGLNTNDYLTSAAEEETPAEEEAPEEPESAKASKPKRKKTKDKPLSRMADWVESYLLKHESPVDAARAITRYLIGGKVDKDKRTINITQDLERVAATIYSVLYKDINYQQSLGLVYEVLDKLQRDLPTEGRGWLRDNVGVSALHKLAGAVWRDDRENGLMGDRTYKDYIRKALSFDLMPGDGRVFLYETQEMLEKTPVAYAGDDATEAEEKEAKAHNSRRKGLINQTKRPIGCKIFKQRVTTTWGRKLMEHYLRCASKACTSCYMIQLMLEWELVLPKWEKIGGPFHFVTLPLESTDQIKDLQKHMHRCARPKMMILGMDNGKPTVMWISTNSTDAAFIYGRACGWPGDQMPKEFQVDTAEEALGLAMEQKSSFHAHTRDLIESKNTDGWVKFMDWTYRKQTVVSRSKRALPWATKEALKEGPKKRSQGSCQDAKKPRNVPRVVGDQLLLCHPFGQQKHSSI